jgi:hypothetical protein
MIERPGFLEWRFDFRDFDGSPFHNESFYQIYQTPATFPRRPHPSSVRLIPTFNLQTTYAAQLSSHRLAEPASPQGFSAINIFGLAIGIAACLLILQYVRFELSYDDFHAKADRVYRVRQDRYNDGKLSTQWAAGAYAAGATLSRTLSGNRST